MRTLAAVPAPVERCVLVRLAGFEGVPLLYSVFAAVVEVVEGAGYFELAVR